MWLEPPRLALGRRLAGQRLRAHRTSRVRELVQHAWETVPFYRDAWGRAGVDPDDVRTPEELEKLPVIRRADLQEATAEERVSRGTELEACVVRQSGGSTGRPLTIYMSRREALLEALGWVRTWRRLGLRLRDLQAAIKDPDDALSGGRPHWFQRLGLLRVRHFDVLRLAPEAIARELTELRPQVVRGSPSALLGVAGSLSPEGASGTRLLFTAGEVLTAGARTRLERSFGAPVRDCYGASEAGCIGWRCPDCGHVHVNSGQVIVEVLKRGRPARPGEVGEVVITNLFARTMPLVRVALGDLCRLAGPGDECPAGDGETPALAELLGREVDRIVLADGRTVSPYVFMPDDAEWIREYQVLQEEPGEVRVMVVPGDGFSREAMEGERRKYEEMVEGACTVSFEVVEVISRRPGEKHKPVISRVDLSGAASGATTGREP